MANDELRYLGLRPINQPFGNMSIRAYALANTSQAIFLYQPVALNNSGQVSVAAIGDNVQLLGTVVGFLDADFASLPSGNTSLSSAPNLASGANGTVLVADDPNQEFILEADTGGGSTISQTNVGNTVGFTYLGSGTGNTTTGIANVLLDASDAAADSGGSFKIVSLYNIINQDGTLNAGGSNFAKVLVKINHHQLGLGSVSAAV